MSTKFMKVYICDYCHKLAPRETAYCGIGDIIKVAPKGWKRFGSMDLCPTCAANFKNAMEGNSNESISE